MGQKPILRGLLTVCACAFFVFQDASAAVGEIDGSFEVTQRGAASYRIPIDVPPGTAGIAPNLALQYSSHGGNGALGVGWSLTGLSRISRCPATHAQDGFFEGVDFDFDAGDQSFNDRLCLDGSRLVPVSGEYGHSGTEYRTEIERFLKVVQKGGDLNSAGVWFKVWTKDGLVKEYGRDNEAALAVPGQTGIYQWAVNRIADTVDNYIEIHYGTDPDDHEQYLDRIDYTGNVSTGLAPYNSVRFVYEDRPDKSSRYLPGDGDTRIRTTRRLKTVETYAGPDLVREYRLTYGTSPTSGRSLLQDVELCAHDSSGADCLTKTRFTWTDPEPGYTEASSLKPPFNIYANQQQGEAIDIDGDGRTDMVRAHGGTRTTWLNTQDGDSLSWQTSSAYQLPGPLFTDDGERVALLADVNGDGLPDYVQGHGSDRETWINTGSGWQADERYKLPHELFGTAGDSRISSFGVLRDLDRDALPDLLITYAGDDGSSADDVWLNNHGCASGVSCAWQPPPASSSWQAPATMFQIPDSDEDPVETRAWLRDLDGNGLPDYVVAHRTEGESAELHTYLNFGADRLPPGDPEVASYGWGTQENTAYNLPAPLVVHESDGDAIWRPSRLVDVNSDGLPDLVCAIRGSSLDNVCGPSEVDAGGLKRATYLNTGDGFVYDAAYNLPEALSNSSTNPNTTEAFFHDLTGDGGPEFIRAHTNHSRRTYVNHSGDDCSAEGCMWQEDPGWQFPFSMFGSSAVRGGVGQLDVDGRTDFFLSKSNQSNKTYVVGSDASDSVVPDLIGTISRDHEDADATFSFSHGTLLSSNSYIPGDSDYPNVSMANGFPVVTLVTTTNWPPLGLYNMLRTITVYRYTDLRVNVLGRGALGFRKVEMKDVHDKGMTVDTITEYAQDFPHTGQIVEMTRRGAAQVDYYYDPYSSGSIMLPNYPGEAILTQQLNELSTKEFGSGTSKRYFPYIESKDERFYDPTDDATPLRTTRTEKTYDDFGNPVSFPEYRTSRK